MTWRKSVDGGYRVALFQRMYKRETSATPLQVTANQSKPEPLYNYEQRAFVHFYVNPSSSLKNLPLSLQAIKTSRVLVPLSGAILHHFQK